MIKKLTHRRYVWIAYSVETFDMILAKDALGVFSTLTMAKLKCERFARALGYEQVVWSEGGDRRTFGEMFKEGDPEAGVITFLVKHEPIIERMELEEK